MPIAKDESGQVLRVTGTLGIALAAEFHSALRGLIEEARQPVVDLSGLEGCDATALQLLCSARRTAEGVVKHLELSGLSTPFVNAAVALGLPLPEASAGPVAATTPGKRGDQDAV